MNRRIFLRRLPTFLGLAGLAGGSIYLRHSWSVRKVRGELLAAAEPPLIALHTKQIKDLPKRGAEEIRNYFHGRCLNVGSFVKHICSDQFRSRLRACATLEEKEQCFLLAFWEYVGSEGEMLTRVQQIAAELGTEIDSAWGHYCTQTCERWKASLNPYGASLSVEEFSRSVDQQIGFAIQKACQESRQAMLLTSVGDVAKEIGRSALLALPLLSFGKAGFVVAIPVFVVLAVQSVWRYVVALYDDPRPALQQQVSARLAHLGNRIAQEFEQTLRERLADLHRWQQEAIHDAADRISRERVPLL